jgi:RHH-type proline utilization regulon transcriptional repressor/proline dehydrogenase/delta 1-pyrroline-5-carboxylate dehydrogenase
LLEARRRPAGSRRAGLLPLLVREAGKTAANAVAEVREAVDFLRYYGAEIRRDFDNTTHKPLGPVVCISPWNFPLAIFTGQVAAALAAGNVVLAKPAEQTPLVAAAAVRALHCGRRAARRPATAARARRNRGRGAGGRRARTRRPVHRFDRGGAAAAARAGRPLTAAGQVVPLIAETGGQNAMVVDSSALAEQAVADIVSSAFDSCGQRCSALRLLCVQDDGADRLLEMLQGAVLELEVGDPRFLATDVGPVIDADAKAIIENHATAMAAKGCRVWRLPLALDAELAERGHFVAPTVIEVERVADLGREVFGPVLHVLRYRRERLPETLEAINATGYGLTQGVHTRIDETVAQVVGAARAGNLYVNRNVVGAVVGVQPFGGEGLRAPAPRLAGRCTCCACWPSARCRRRDWRWRIPAP